MILHILHNGAALCGLPGAPCDWPEGHKWVDRRGFLLLAPGVRAEACPECVKLGDMKISIVVSSAVEPNSMFLVTEPSFETRQEKDAYEAMSIEEKAEYLVRAGKAVTAKNVGTPMTSEKPKTLDAKILEALAPFEGRKATLEVMQEMGKALGKVFDTTCGACHRTESVGADLQKDINGVRFCGECAKHHGTW